MARQAAAGLLGIHINLPATVRRVRGARRRDRAAGLSDKERTWSMRS